MSPFEWFSVGVGVVSVLGVWLTGIAWWSSRSTNRLIQAMHRDTQQTLDRIDARAETRYQDLKDRLGGDEPPAI
jgi:hypothetical protein